MNYASAIGNSALGAITQVATSAATRALGSTAGSLASAATSALTGGASLNSAVGALTSQLGNHAASAVAGLAGGIPGISGLAAGGASATSPADTSWTFICTPDEISWTTSNAVNRVEMFGTNNPPAISGTKGMREFSLNNALVEGFTRNKKVEAKVAALEDLMKYKPSTTGGYVNVPVYQVWANEKGYGQQAYYLIKSVQVKETMRDLSGDATRAYVDVSFIEVPAFQVDSGIDQAPFSQQGADSSIVKAALTGSQAQLEAAKSAASVAGKATQGAAAAAGANAPSPKPATPLR